MASPCTFTPGCPHEAASESAVLVTVARLHEALPGSPVGNQVVLAMRLTVVAALNAGACHACALKELHRLTRRQLHLSEVAHA